MRKDSNSGSIAVRRILIIGISGTGKSTFARKLAARLQIPCYHMDSFIWKEHWIEAQQEEVEASLQDVHSQEAWIVEGWLDSYSHSLIESSDLILYLDFSGWRALIGGLQRWWNYRGTHRPELANGCTESLDFGYLAVMLFRKERPHIEKVLEKYSPKNVVRVHSRSQLKAYLTALL